MSSNSASSAKGLIAWKPQPRLVLPVPYELRQMIYEYLEPHLLLSPQCHSSSRPPYRTHPLIGVNSYITAELNSRYVNLNNPKFPPFSPAHTTFRLYGLSAERAQMRQRDFFSHDPHNASGVRDLEFVFDLYKSPDDDDDMLAVLRDFPRLETLKVIICSLCFEWYPEWTIFRNVRRLIACYVLENKMTALLEDDDGQWGHVKEKDRPKISAEVISLQQQMDPDFRSFAYEISCAILMEDSLTDTLGW